MALSSDDDVIVITLTDSDHSKPQSSVDEELLISTAEILSWDLPSILRSPTVNVLAHRSRLIDESSYFHGMLKWTFSESGLGRVSIEWDMESFVNILKCIYGCSVEIAFENFVSLNEGALYFGVKTLLEKCNTWFYEVATSTSLPQIALDDLSCIWNFELKHGNGFLSEVCTSYLARNFMWAISCKSFVDVPYSLLVACMKHNCLTIESEMHLCEALFIWLDANTGDTEGSSSLENDYANVLTQIYPTFLPLWFVAEKRRSRFPKLADESIGSVFRLLNTPVTSSMTFVEGNELTNCRIRLTEYSTKMNLSSCPQITSAMLLLSLLPSSYIADSTLSNIEKLLVKLQSVGRDCFPVLQELSSMLSFEAVEEVNISKCLRLNLQASIGCFSVSFPSLKILKAAYFLHFNVKDFRHLVYKCPMVLEVDLAVDISPLISEQDSRSYLTVSEFPASIEVLSSWKSRPMMSNITKLILEGRSELCDSDLLFMSKFCIYLQYINVRGCTELTDSGLATLIQRRVRLQSIIACHTSFGFDSVQALCSTRTRQGYGNTSAQLSESMAFHLRALHIGGCNSIDETSLLKLLSETKMLKSLSLRNTNLTDCALYSLAVSSLEILDVSNTTVSGAAVANLVFANPGLKRLRVTGCNNVSQLESNAAEEQHYPSTLCQNLEMALGKTCRLEEFSFGWGFSHFSMEALKPAIKSLTEITMGLGGSLGEFAIRHLPMSCPNLRSIVLHFQAISDDVLINIMTTLRNLQVLALCYCFGDISNSGFNFSMLNLKKLQLKRVTPWMTNNDLVILAQSFPNLGELSLLGCPHLDSDSQQIISRGWPGLVSMHLEECGEVTANGVSSLLDCVALEDLLLRHNGHGIHKTFLQDAASKLPLLRKVSLDLCDSVEGYFDLPPVDQSGFLRAVKIARCKLKECGLNLSFLEPRKKPVHKETLVLEWTSKNITRNVVKERL